MGKRKKTVRVCVTLFVFAIFLVGTGCYSRSVKKTPLQSDDNVTFEKAKVTEVISETTDEDEVSGMAGSQDVKVKVLSGTYRGRIIEATNINGYLYGADCEVGTRVIIQLSAYEDEVTASVYGYDREWQMYGLIGLFILILVVVGGRRGICSTVALIFTFVCLIFMYLPMLYQGWDPFVATILTVVIITVVSLLLIGGYTKKTVCALAGTIAGVAVSGCVAMFFGKIAHISGWNTEDVENMVYVAQNSNVQIGDLLYAGILIASLGAVMDVAMSVSSTVFEIYDRTPQIKKSELFKSGIHVGRDMMGTMSNTLILAFAGSSLNTMILIYAYSFPYRQIVNMYSIGIEILRGLSGTIGIILTVPFVSLIASTMIYGKKTRRKNK